MSQLYYELTTPGTPPVTLAQVKEYLRLPDECPDDDLLTAITLAATQAVERAIGRREIRANTWTLLLDEFCDRIPLRRVPVASITSVSRLVSGSFSAVASSVYYLKRSQHCSEILLNPDEAWPTDQDDGVEHGVQVIFVTQADESCLEVARLAIRRLVAYLYENRGDCDPTDADAALDQSGANGLLQFVKIQKV